MKRIDMDFATFARLVKEGTKNCAVTASYLLTCYGEHMTVSETISKIIKDGTCQALNN